MLWATARQRQKSSFRWTKGRSCTKIKLDHFSGVGQVRLQDQVTNRAPQKGKFDEMLELALQLHANSCKIWKTGGIILRRTVLKLAFADRLTYHRNEGGRNQKIFLLFKYLYAFLTPKVQCGAGGGTRTHTGKSPSDFKSDMSTIPSRPQRAFHRKFWLTDPFGSVCSPNSTGTAVVVR